MVDRKAARRYARALFYQAQEEGEVATTREALDALAAAHQAQPALGPVLRHPLIPAERKREVLRQALEGATDGPVPEGLREFIGLVVDKRRTALLPAIAELFAALADAAARVVRADVRCAVPLTAEEQERLRAVLGGVFGGTPVLELQVDPSLIGGAIVRVGDTVFDGSVRRSLRVLAQDLKVSVLATTRQ